MKITTHRKKKHFGGGWHCAVTLEDGRVATVVFARGARQGLYFGRTSWTWHATIKHDGKEVWRGRARLNASAKSLVRRWLAGERLGLLDQQDP